MEVESGTVEIGNAHMYYELAGAGQPVVLIHAGVADNRQWNNEFAAFSQDFRVLRYDLRGHGKSLPVEGEYSNLGDLVALLDRLGLQEPLVLMGCSMGGGLAMDFALEHPARVKALIMVGSAPNGLDLDVETNPKEDEAEQAYEAGDLDRVAELEAEIFFDGMGRTPHQVNQKMRKRMIEMNRLALSHSAKNLGKRVRDTDTPAAERLGELDIPVLVIIGEYDEPYIHAAADYMVDKMTDARKVIMEDAAHLPNMDHPQVFQREVRGFLEGN